MFRAILITPMFAAMLLPSVLFHEPPPMSAEQELQSLGAGGWGIYACQVIGTSCDYHEFEAGDDCTPEQVGDEASWCGTGAEDEECELKPTTTACSGSWQSGCPPATVIKCSIHAGGGQTWVQIGGQPDNDDCGHHLACM